jgi:pimeloyl-ACP methyl ester carboxylesterase
MAGMLENTLAVLNGVLGDYLARTDNGLATEIEVFGSTSGHRPLPLERGTWQSAVGATPAKVLVLAHGLMCTESVWRMPDGSDYGTRLAADFGYLPLYVRYNTGLPIAESGEHLDRVLGRLVASYPRPIEEIAFIGHSMGGLIMRSACHAACLGDDPSGSAGPVPTSAWLPKVHRAIYIGTPHLGSPLERVGRVVTKILRAVPDPYTRLVAEIADLRSRGIKDLGDGLHDTHHPIPLLPEIEHYLVAASLSDDPWLASLFGDSLVPVASATNGAHHPMGAALPPDHVKVMPGASHMAIAHDPAVYEHIKTWCGGTS